MFLSLYYIQSSIINNTIQWNESFLKNFIKYGINTWIKESSKNIRIFNQYCKKKIFHVLNTFETFRHGDRIVSKRSMRQKISRISELYPRCEGKYGCARSSAWKTRSEVKKWSYALFYAPTHSVILNRAIPAFAQVSRILMCIFAKSFAVWTSWIAWPFISFAWRFHELPRPVAATC